MPRMRYCPACAAPLVPAARGGRERLVCSDGRCGFVHWDNPVPVVAAIAERDGAIIQVRSRGWPAGWYGLITGFLEAGEMPEQAVLREVQEEVGLAATLQDYCGMYPFYEMNQLLIVYHVTVAAGPIRLDESELDGHREVALGDVQPWPRGTGIALRDWLVERGYEPEFVPLP